MRMRSLPRGTYLILNFGFSHASELSLYNRKVEDCSNQQNADVLNVCKPRLVQSKRCRITCTCSQEREKVEPGICSLVC